MTDWIYRINVVAPIDERDHLNALWTVIAPDGDDEAETFRAALSPNGQFPASHTGTSTIATEEMMLMITQVLADELASDVVSVQDYRENNWSSLLASINLKPIAEILI